MASDGAPQMSSILKRGHWKSAPPTVVAPGRLRTGTVASPTFRGLIAELGTSGTRYLNNLAHCEEDFERPETSAWCINREDYLLNDP